MTSTNSKLLMMGLRGSGKTTYLAALWHALESGELEDDFAVPFLQTYRDYLNQIRSNWLTFKPVGRTSIRISNQVTIPLVNKMTNKSFELDVPDLSGESFRLQWANRKATNHYASFAPQVSGLFLFIHPQEVLKTHPLRVVEVADEPTDEHPEQQGPRILSSKNWDPTKSSTQVQLVDILQILMRLRGNGRKLRMAVMISAWDTITARVTPSGWLERQMPLLAQYLISNGDWLTSEIFGISAQGGDLDKDLQKLENISKTSDRCFVLQGGDLSKVSLATPLRFVLDDE